MKLAITYADVTPKPNFIAWAVALDTPYMTCEQANAEVIRLKVENLRLQSIIDAGRIKS